MSTVQEVTNTASSELNDLMVKVADGDQDAFTSLYELTASRMYGLIIKIMHDAAQSEEVLQEVFLEIWQQATRYTPRKGSAVGWMLSITHRRTVDRIRSAQASTNRDKREGAKNILTDYNHVDETVEAHLQHDNIVEALNHLTVVQKQCVVLAYYEGFSQTQISEQLSVPLGTVKTRIRDGMIRLRDELGVAA